MATSVNNPTNAKPWGGPLPFTSPKQISALAKVEKEKDPFNNGKDYKDEGAPLFTNESSVKVQPRAYASFGQGIVNAPTSEEIKALTSIDESAQGTHIRYLKEAIVMDVDAKLILSTTAQMKRAMDEQDITMFREAHYPTLPDYMNSQHYRKLRESQIKLSHLSKFATKTNLERATVAGIRVNPQLVQRFRTIDNNINRHLRESGHTKQMEKLRESMQKGKESGRRLREDFFSMDGPPGSFGVGQTGPNFDGGQSFGLAGREPDFIPLIGGPYNKQLYFADYLDMHAKAYEAWTHNPVAKRICKVITQFVLGKGVKITVMEAKMKTGRTTVDPNTQQPVPEVNDYREQAQAKLDGHWMKNAIHIRSKQILRDLIIFGEQFIRYYDAPWGLKLRSLDPSTVWEVITDPDDCENEFYIHQQYPTRYQWFVDLPVPTIKFIIRQVPALLYYHMKINCTATEVRGRSELFAILGWLKRLKEFASDRVIRNKMANLFVLDVAVEGDAAAVQAVQQQMSTPPTPGSFFFHNKAAELKGVPAEIGAGEVNNDWELLLTVVSMGAGLSQQYLGMSAGGGKAEALVGTEPDIKTFEDYQEIMESFFLQDAQRLFQRCIERKELPQGLNIKVEVTYPALAEENRSEKLKDLAFGESMSWWSHRRIASAAAKEMQFTSYDYDEEQVEIAKEDAKKLTLINTAYQQVTKGTDSATAGASGGTSSGSSGKGASGMGMGKMGSGGSGGSKQSATGESIREAEADEDEMAPATAPGTSSASSVSGMAVTHNASVGADGKRDPWSGRDPRDVAQGIKREATNLRYDRRGIGRRNDRIQSPSKVRDQKTLDRGEVLGDAKKARHSGNLGHESSSGSSNGRTLGKVGRKDVESVRQSADGITRFPRYKETFQPFKQQDGEKLQSPKVMPVEDHSKTIKGFGANKRESFRESKSKMHDGHKSPSRFLKNGKKKSLKQRQREGFYPEIR